MSLLYTQPSVRLANGEVVSLFQSPLPPPYICFMVVTKHLNNEDLFSTKYQLSFASVLNRYDRLIDTFVLWPEYNLTYPPPPTTCVDNDVRAGSAAFRSLLIGRSRSCDMVLDYRTVNAHIYEVVCLCNSTYMSQHYYYFELI